MPGENGGSAKPALPGVGRAGMPLGIAVLAALLYSLSSGPGSRPAAGSGDKMSGSEAAEPSRDSLQPLYEFLDVQSGTGDKPGRCIGFRQYSVEFVIATVPDPIDSHLAPSFDRAIDAIQRGLQSTGWMLDRFWIPWKRESESRWQLTTEDSLPTVVAKSAPSDVHRKLPGTLLFRDPSDERRLFVVFLVGELPTRGVQRRALSEALEAIERTEHFDQKHPCLFPARRSIRLLGPYFSGSTESLINGLLAWNSDRATRIRILSGSATVDSNADKMRHACLDFKATVVPDLLLTYEFDTFLRGELNATPQDVAIFVEGGTTYGSANINFNERESLKRLTPGCGSGGEDPDEPSMKDWIGQFRPRFTVDFPLHVAQLRAAYEKDEALRMGGQSRGPRHSLELALETGEHASSDIVHPLDGVATAGSADLTLGDSIETIRRERIRFVGIIASDPRDVLFLARRIREAGSDATLFTYGADILFTHPDYVRFLRGMLVVTPYPLFPGNQAVTRTGWQRVSFAGSSEEGIYNAMRYFGGKKDRLLDYREPDLGRNDRPSRPPIWVTVVGRESFWPVRIAPRYWEGEDIVSRLALRYVLPSDPIQSPVPRPAAPDQTDRPNVPHPPGSAVALVLTEFVLGLLAFWYWMARHRQPSLAALRQPGFERRRLPEYVRRYFSIWGDADGRRVNGAYVFLLMLIGSAAQAAMTITLVWTRPFLGERVLITALLWLGSAVFLALVAALLREAIRLARESVGVKGWRLILAIGWALLAVTVSIIAVAALLRYRVFLKSASSAQLFVFYSRVGDLTSAVSPVLPLGFFGAVLVLWAGCNLDRAYFMEVRGASNESLDGATMTGLVEAENSICRILFDSWARFVFLVIPLVVFVPFYRIVRQPFDTVDGSYWGALLKGLFLISYGVVAYSLTLFVGLWINLRQLLQRLSRHPLAPAFQRLPDSLATSPWKMWRAVPSLTTLHESVRQLRLLANLEPGGATDGLWTSIRASADDAEAALEVVNQKTHLGFIATIPLQQAVKEKLKTATSSILGSLQSVWNTWPRTPYSGFDLPKDASKDASKDAESLLRLAMPNANSLWVHAAEEFVAIRVSSYIRYVFLQMKNLLSFSLIGFILGVAAAASYPFQPRRPVMALVWVVGTLSISAVGWVIVSIDRDRILSYIGKTPAGEVSLNHEFLTTATLYVVVPLLTLLATQFPGIGDFVYSVFTPAIKSGK